MPIDLIPDFVPVIGYADDAIIVAIGLRSVVRAAGPEVIAAHWPGTDTGLAVLHRLAGLPAPETPRGAPSTRRPTNPRGSAPSAIRLTILGRCWTSDSGRPGLAIPVCASPGLSTGLPHTA